MYKNINQLRILKAITISFSFIYTTNYFYGENELTISSNLFISIGIYTILSYVALNAYELSKPLGLVLFFSITFLSPNMYPGLEGQLFPVTYVIFALFLTYFLGKEMFKKWKTTL